MARGLVFTISGAPRTKKNSPRVLPILQGANIGRLRAMLNGNHAQCVRALMSLVQYSVQPSEAYEEWFASIYPIAGVIKRAAAASGLELPLACPVAVKATFYREADRGDLLGYEDAVSDAIQADQYKCQSCGKKSYVSKCSDCNFSVMKPARKGLGIITDDKLIKSWDGSRLEVDKTNPRIELVIEVIEQAQLTLEL